MYRADGVFVVEQLSDLLEVVRILWRHVSANPRNNCKRRVIVSRGDPELNEIVYALT